MGYDSVLGFHAKKMIVNNGYGDKTIVALWVQQADSNSYEIKGNRRVMSRSWIVFKIAEEWEVMTSVIKWSSSAESGMLKLKGKWVGAESIIRLARKAISTALVVDKLSSHRLGEPYISSLDIALPFKIKETILSIKNDYRKKDYEKALLSCNSDSTSYDYQIFSWSVDKKGVEAFLEVSYIFDSTVLWSSSRTPWDFSPYKESK